MRLNEKHMCKPKFSLPEGPGVVVGDRLSTVSTGAGLEVILCGFKLFEAICLSTSDFRRPLGPVEVTVLGSMPY